MPEELSKDIVKEVKEQIGDILYEGYRRYCFDIRGYSSAVTRGEFNLVCEFLHEVFEKLEKKES